MDRQARRPCPICGGSARTRTFPYKTRFNDVTFDYLRCRSCSSVFVDPAPEREAYYLSYILSRCVNIELLRTKSLTKKFMTFAMAV